MSRDALSLQLDEGDAPAFLRIAQAVMRDVRRGRLKPGQKLPGSRTWAKHLGFHRNTVLAALTELEAQGWVTTVQAQGTFVSTALPEELAECRKAGMDDCLTKPLARAKLEEVLERYLSKQRKPVGS
jgi:GntR family transcriptional regulator/MocR family aminotransferase